MPTTDAGTIATGRVVSTPTDVGVLTARGVAPTPADAGDIAAGDVASISWRRKNFNEIHKQQCRGARSR